MQDSPGDFWTPVHVPALRLGVRLGLERVGNVKAEARFGDLLENRQ